MKKNKGRAGKNPEKTKWWALLAVAMCGLFAAAGQVMIKFGTAKMTGSLLSAFNLQIIIGLLIYLIGTSIFLALLKYGDVTIMFPMAATSYIWTTIFSSVLLGEIITAAKWSGNFLIIAGISLIGYSSRIEGNRR